MRHSSEGWDRSGFDLRFLTYSDKIDFRFAIAARGVIIQEYKVGGI